MLCSDQGPISLTEESIDKEGKYGVGGRTPEPLGVLSSFINQIFDNQFLLHALMSEKQKTTKVISALSISCIALFDYLIICIHILN